MLESLAQTFQRSSFVIRVNLCYLQPSLFLYELFLFRWRFAVLVNHYVQVIIFYEAKRPQKAMSEILSYYRELNKQRR